MPEELTPMPPHDEAHAPGIEYWFGRMEKALDKQTDAIDRLNVALAALSSRVVLLEEWRNRLDREEVRAFSFRNSLRLTVMGGAVTLALWLIEHAGDLAAAVARHLK